MLWLMASLFDQPINSELKTYENVRQIATGKGYGYIYNWLFVKLLLFWRKVQDDCNEFK